MAISTQLIGKLGGIETQQVQINDDSAIVPKGWKKAVGVFKGKLFSGEDYAVIFGDRVKPYGGSLSLNGGGVLTAGGIASFSNVSGTLTWYRLE